MVHINSYDNRSTLCTTVQYERTGNATGPLLQANPYPHDVIMDFENCVKPQSWNQEDLCGPSSITI